MTSRRLKEELIKLLENFDSSLESEDIRTKVLNLVPAVETMRKLGKSLIPDGLKISARNRILKYFLTYPYVVINEKEIAVVAGISEWARRLRELRVEHGWAIVSGVTVSEMAKEDDFVVPCIEANKLKPGDYILISKIQDREAAYRWNVIKDIRKQKISMRDKILLYLQKNVGCTVLNEELREVAGGTEWARRVRELRTEYGWPIATKHTGRPDLPVGAYILEKNEQLPVHDRTIPDGIRRTVMQRDNHTCQMCGWNHKQWNPSDPRHLEVHHKIRHVDGGTSDPENLVTYCNICHDQIHSQDK